MRNNGKILRLILILILIASLCRGQSNLDYQLYSKQIDSFITEGAKYNIETKEVVIFKKYLPTQNEISNLVEELQDTDVNMLKMVMHYDTVKLRLCNDESFRKAIFELEKDFFNTPTLDEQRFTIKTRTKAMTAQQFQELFGKKTGKGIDKGWKRFYTLNPGSHGIFEFSKIFFAGNYACFYVGRHSNGLSGSGDIIVMQKDNNIWRILVYFNIWMA